MKTTFVKGVEICEHSINVNYCAKCKDAPKKTPAISLGRSMWLKILDVLADGQWHTTKDIAEKAGLLEAEGYADIGRCIRKWRDEDHSPVDSRPCGDMRHEYCLLSLEAADEFWARHAVRKTKQRTAVVESLGADILADLREQNKFLQDYIANLEAENADLKRQIAFSPAETVKVASN